MKKLLSVLVSILLCTALVACGGNASPSSEVSSSTKASTAAPSAQGTDKETLKIAVSMASLEDIGQVAQLDFMKEAVDAYNETNPEVKMEMKYLVATGDATVQNTQILDLINEKPDILFCNIQDATAIWSSVTACQDNGIPFVAWGRTLTEGGPEADCVIVSDNEQQCYDVTKALIEKMLNDGIALEDIKLVNLLGSLTDDNAQNMQKGHEKAMAEFGITPVAKVETDWNPEQCLTRLAAVLEAQPDVNAIFIPSDSQVPSVEAALTNIGRWVPYGEENHVYVAGRGTHNLAIAAIEGGYMDFDVLDNLYAIGTTPIEVCKSLINGEKLPDVLVVDAPLVTPDNIKNDSIDGSVIWAKRYM